MKTLILIMLITATSIACDSNLDCAFGSRCIKSSPYNPGFCAGGMNPGNNNDNNPVYKQNSRQGRQCTYDTECGYGSECMKSGYNLYGVCVDN